MLIINHRIHNSFSLLSKIKKAFVKTLELLFSFVTIAVKCFLNTFSDYP